MIVIDDVPGFYRDHRGRLGIDVAIPFDQRAEFERQTVPGIERIELSDSMKG